MRKADEQMKRAVADMRGFCGVNCGKCEDYLSGKCKGCWADLDEKCFFVKCNTEHGTQSCAYCEQFPCNDILEFSKESDSHQEAYQALQKVHETLR